MFHIWAAILAPVADLVVARNADPGTTVVAGQAVVQVIDPASLWILGQREGDPPIERRDQIGLGHHADQLLPFVHHWNMV